jgi:hypothetical protein
MAVNVGYSIGWGFPLETYTPYLYFSSCYVVVGSSMVAMALGLFVDQVVADADNWFINLQQKEAYEKAIAPGQPIFQRIRAWRIYRKQQLNALALWFFWIALMTMYSMINLKWTFAEAQYYAISSLSTGGLYAIPREADNLMYGITGFFCCLGVPIMGRAMGSLAKLLVSTGDLDEVKETISANVTTEELEFLRKLELEDGDGMIDQSEFIVLCMMRLGTDPNVVQFIVNRFHELDDDNNGTLEIHEITQSKRQSIDEDSNDSFGDARASGALSSSSKKKKPQTRP